MKVIFASTVAEYHQDMTGKTGRGLKYAGVIHTGTGLISRRGKGSNNFQGGDESKYSQKLHEFSKISILKDFESRPKN